MTFGLIPLAQCAEFSGLGSNEMLLGVTPSAMHHSLYVSYLPHIRRGSEAVRDMIIADIRSSLKFETKRAADLLIVLRWFLSGHPEARLCPPARQAEVVDFCAFAGNRNGKRHARFHALCGSHCRRPAPSKC